MKVMRYIVVSIAMLLFAGCQAPFVFVDLTPPSPPQGIYTETGDGQVEIFWNRNPEPDLDGYHVLVSRTYSGPFSLIGTTRQTHFVDNAARNGTTYYYAITSYDFSGNESELSTDVAYDTPRPEGYDVVLNNYRTNPATAGYDFSTYSIGPYDDAYTDVFFENYNGVLYLNTWEDSDIQDVGYTSSLYDIGDAPTQGWSPSKDVRVITGHTYVVWTWDNHYAKLRVTSLSGTRVVFDWAYQLQTGNTRLKSSVGTDRGALTQGSGVAGRH